MYKERKWYEENKQNLKDKIAGKKTKLSKLQDRLKELEQKRKKAL